MANEGNHDLDKLHKQLSLLARRYQLRGQQEPLAFGLTVSEGYALGILMEHSSLTMGQLAKELNLSLAAATKIVKKLCKVKLATRTTGKEDKRIQLVSPTSKGQKNFSKLQLEFKSHLRGTLEGFSPSEIAIIARGIENINSSIDEWRKVKSHRPMEVVHD